MAREMLTDAQVEMEIERLTESEYVKLARQEQRLRYKQRQYLYQLRWMEKRGRQLATEGVTAENLEAMLNQIEADGAEE